MTASDPSSPFRLKTFSWANLAKYLRYCRTYGVQNATRLAFRKVLRRGRLPGVMEPLPLPQLAIEATDRIDPPVKKKISVIIPTRNAGHEFITLLGKLRAQRGIEQIEIIVVDSGSTDQTVAVAKTAGAEVIQIPPGAFTHSYSRNRGAERATGDYLLFIVQDALPLTDSWLWVIARTLETTNVVGVSCAEYPRADCDLFYQLLIWNHYRSLQLDRDRILQWDSSCDSTEGLRANAQLSGISFLVHRDVFEKYRYAGDYAEDLELGIRLIRDRHKIGFLYSTRVLHSHNRPPYYFLKRGYVDVRHLARVLPGFTFPQITDKERLIDDAVSLHQRLAAITYDVSQPVPAEKFLEDLKAALQTRDSGRAKVPSDEFGRFVRRLKRSEMAAVYDPGTNMILPHVIQHLSLLKQFLSESYPQVEETLTRQMQECVMKIFALHVGTHFGYLYLASTNGGRPRPDVEELDRELVRGV